MIDVSRDAKIGLEVQPLNGGRGGEPLLLENLNFEKLPTLTTWRSDSENVLVSAAI